MKKIPSLHILQFILPYVLIGYLYFNILILHEMMISSKSSSSSKDVRPLGPYHSRKVVAERINETLLDRVSTLELKLNTYLSYKSDPFFWNKITAECNNFTDLIEYCTNDECRDEELMRICLDDFPYNDCVVYDFGIRKEPYFGVVLASPPFNCQVFAFDPSPITQEWFESNTELKKLSNYHLFHYGGGGGDETITLRKYNWGQVSIYSYPQAVIADPRNCTDGACRSQMFSEQELIQLPVRSVGSIMKEFGHSQIDVLKIDVEGSEYQMLEGLIDSRTCLKINQITMEWHHYGYDVRYGHSSSPILNLFGKLLQEKCGLSQFYLCDWTGWPANTELYLDMKITLMYNLAAFMRVKPN
jgi:FkbM family methyltransferase